MAGLDSERDKLMDIGTVQEAIERGHALHRDMPFYTYSDISSQTTTPFDLTAYLAETMRGMGSPLGIRELHQIAVMMNLAYVAGYLDKSSEITASPTVPAPE